MADKTHFPKHGDNEPVSLENSRYPLFDVAFARDLKDHWPDIWDEGGNVIGNEQFDALCPIASRGGAVKTDAEAEAVRKREAWAARHEQDFRLAGTVAQIKWLVVGDCGEAHMREVIAEAKARLRAREGQEADRD